MANDTDYTLLRSEDGNLVINLNPPAPVGGMTIRYYMARRLGSTSALVTKHLASGFNGVSGITVLNSGQGKLQIADHPSEVSGLDPGCYAAWCERVDSGNVTRIWTGARLLGV